MDLNDNIRREQVGNLIICDNERTISKSKYELLKKSIEAQGMIGTIIINSKKEVLSGNQRVRALMELYGEYYEVPCFEYMGKEEDYVKLISNANYAVYNGYEGDMIAKMDKEYLELITSTVDFFKYQHLLDRAVAQADDIIMELGDSRLEDLLLKEDGDGVDTVSSVSGEGATKKFQDFRSNHSITLYGNEEDIDKIKDALQEIGMQSLVERIVECL